MGAVHDRVICHHMLAARMLTDKLGLAYYVIKCIRYDVRSVDLPDKHGRSCRNLCESVYFEVSVANWTVPETCKCLKEAGVTDFLILEKDAKRITLSFYLRASEVVSL